MQVQQQQLPEVQQLPLMEVEQLQAVEQESWRFLLRLGLDALPVLAWSPSFSVSGSSTDELKLHPMLPESAYLKGVLLQLD